MVFRIHNREARRFWLQSQGLSETPTGSLDLASLVHRLGFVQIDTIRNVTRAHHHILWSRNQNYREPMIWAHLNGERAVFEHFTHDASLIPMEFYPLWQRQFKRLGHNIERYKYFETLTPDYCSEIMAKIETSGPLCTRDFEVDEPRTKEMWARPKHKRALDYLWYRGDLSTSHRENFIKFYNLTDRVIPQDIRAVTLSDHEQIDGLCHEALTRLGFGTLGDIQRFWAATTSADVRAWKETTKRRLVPISYQTASGDWRGAFAHEDIEDRVNQVRPASSRLRIINPFDPAVRDRNRLQRLFGFTYKNEMFVPVKDRKWGYYVYPILEGDKFIGRTELKANRAENTLSVLNLWTEPKTQWTGARRDKFAQELKRLGRLVGVSEINNADIAAKSN